MTQTHPLFEEYTAERNGSVVRVALSGGPHAGKSTLMRFIQERFLAKAICLEETMTMMLRAGITQVPEDPSLINTWLTRLQPAILLTQMMREQEAYDKAAREGIPALICDRGVADALVYLPGKHEKLLQLFPGITASELHKGYDLVIHLESLSTANPELFGKAGNDDRYEDLAKAQEVEYATRIAWQDHPNYHFISGKDGIDKVIERAMAILTPVLS